MSRHVIPAKEPEKYEVVVGYDRPLNIFFGQVYDRLMTDEEAEEIENSAEYHGGDPALILWLDAEPTVNSLAKKLSLWADVTDDIKKMLLKDAEEEGATPNSSMQNHFARLFYANVPKKDDLMEEMDLQDIYDKQKAREAKRQKPEPVKEPEPVIECDWKIAPDCEPQKAHYSTMGMSLEEVRAANAEVQKWTEAKWKGQEVGPRPPGGKGICHPCFLRLFWQELIDKYHGQYPAVIVKGVHYVIGEEGAKGFRGFGGSRFMIRYNDGREVGSTNLWYQGEVPEWAKDVLADNATFVEKGGSVVNTKTGDVVG